MPLLRHQLGVGAARFDGAIAKHDDAVCAFDRRQPVRNDERHPAADHVGETPLNVLLGFRVHRGRCLVHDEDLRIGENGAGKRDHLFLPAG
jgi:hypothetical protein